MAARLARIVCAGRAGLVDLRVDVQHHVLGGRHQRIVGRPMHRGEQPHPLLVERHQLHGAVQLLAAVRLADVVDVALDREEAVAASQVVRVHADEPQEAVAGFAGQLHVAAVVHVAVVVHPIARHLHVLQPQRAVRWVRPSTEAPPSRSKSVRSYWSSTWPAP